MYIFSFIFACPLNLLGMAGRQRSKRPSAMEWDESDEEIIFSSLDESDMDFDEDSDEAPAEVLDRLLYLFFFRHAHNVIILTVFLTI